MSTVYRHYVSDRLCETGVSFWIDEGQRQQIASVEYVRIGKALYEDSSGWHDSKPAVLEAIATEIIAKASLLVAQAAKLRSEAAALLATQAETEVTA